MLGMHNGRNTLKFNLAEENGERERETVLSLRLPSQQRHSKRGKITSTLPQLARRL